MRRRRGSWRAAHISEAAKRARSYREAFLAALQASVAGGDTDDEVLSLFALLVQKYKYCQARAQLPRGVPCSAASKRGGGGHRRRGTQFSCFTSTKVHILAFLAALQWSLAGGEVTLATLRARYAVFLLY